MGTDLTQSTAARIDSRHVASLAEHRDRLLRPAPGRFVLERGPRPRTPRTGGRRVVDRAGWSEPRHPLPQVPEGKSVKDRIHLDLRPGDQAAEVERLISLGARRIDIGQGEVTWVVMADPEANEFCVLRPRPSTPA